MDEDARRKEQHREVLVRFFAHLNARDYETAIELFAHDLRWQMPHAPPALPAPFDRERAGKLLRGFPALFSQGLTFDDIKITPMLNPDQFLAEYRGEATMAATGQPYRNTYIAIFELAAGSSTSASTSIRLPPSRPLDGRRNDRTSLDKSRAPGPQGKADLIRRVTVRGDVRRPEIRWHSSVLYGRGHG